MCSCIAYYYYYIPRVGIDWKWVRKPAPKDVHHRPPAFVGPPGANIIEMPGRGDLKSLTQTAGNIHQSAKPYRGITIVSDVGRWISLNSQ